MLNMCASKRIMSTKDGYSGNFNIYFINTSWFWWSDVLNAIGRHVVDSPGLGLFDLVLVELHRLPGTRRRRPLRWRLQNRFGDGEFRRRRCRWRRLVCPEELVHETRFTIFDDALLWWHRGCGRSKRRTGKEKNQLFKLYLIFYKKNRVGNENIWCNNIFDLNKLNRSFRRCCMIQCIGRLKVITKLSLLQALFIDFLLQKSHFKWAVFLVKLFHFIRIHDLNV